MYSKVFTKWVGLPLFYFKCLRYFSLKAVVTLNLRWISHQWDLGAFFPCPPACWCMQCKLRNSRVVASGYRDCSELVVSMQDQETTFHGRKKIPSNVSNSRVSLGLFIKKKNVWNFCACMQLLCPNIHLPFHRCVGTLQDEEHYIQPVFLSNESLWIKILLSQLYQHRPK